MASANDGGAGGMPVKKGGGLLGVLLPAVVLTVLAAGGGGLIGTAIVSAVKGPSTPEVKAAPTPPPEQSQSALKELTPIVTNLASPDNASWIRLQAAILYDKADAPQIDVLSAKINDDILAMVRTLTLAQLEGASGLELLREDLSERASIRSDGHVHELMIEMLVIQ